MVASNLSYLDSTLLPPLDLVRCGLRRVATCVGFASNGRPEDRQSQRYLYRYLHPLPGIRSQSWEVFPEGIDERSHGEKKLSSGEGGKNDFGQPVPSTKAWDANVGAMNAPDRYEKFIVPDGVKKCVEKVDGSDESEEKTGADLL